MKTIILTLWFISGGSIDLNIKVEPGDYCEDALMKTVIWKENPNYKPGNYEIWGYYTYKNRPIFAHTCMNKDKKSYFYYNEGE
jgi:hypothetical protein